MNHRCIRLGIVVLVLLAISVGANAQTTFTVTVAPKSSTHPWAGQGWGEAYRIDDAEVEALTLVRGETYTFQLMNVSSMHPFYISTSASGGGAGVWTEGVTGNFATGNGTLTFTVPENAPDVLYYQCSFHGQMGGLITVVSGGTSAERDDLPDIFSLDQNYPNPFNPETRIVFDLQRDLPVRLTVHDAAGRIIRVLLDEHRPAGAHAVVWDGLTREGDPAPSGTYFYRLESTDGQLTRSMTLIR